MRVCAHVYNNYVCMQLCVRACVYAYVNAYTVNGERFAGLNFRGFHEHCESFPVNIIQASYNRVV